MNQLDGTGPQSSPEIKKRERGGCLSAWLILIIAGNIVMAFINLINATRVADIGWIFALQSFLSVINVVFATAIWNWKKWGVYGLFFIIVMGFVLNLIWGTTLTTLAALIPAILLTLLIQPLWKEFE